MKLIPLVALLLSGCSIFGNLQVAHFDSGEYDRITKVRLLAIQTAGQCQNPASVKALSEQLNTATVELAVYSQGLPSNSDTSKILGQFHNLTSELYKRYDAVGSVSEAYCVDKLAIITDSATTIQRTIGSKPK